MLETGDSSDISVDRLMYEIRETVARQRQNAGGEIAASSIPFQPFDTHASHAPIDSSPLSLQPEFHPRPDNQYHVSDLLKYHGRDFVRHAYRAILKREPDLAGWAQHLENLASGRFNKIDILASLRFSPEGERAQVKLAGLTWPAAIRRLGRAPLIGYLVQLVIAFVRLPRLLQHQRQSEFHLSAQQQQVVDHYNQVHKELAERLAQTVAELGAGAGRAASQQQAIELLSEQQQALATQTAEFRNDIETRLAATRQHVEQSAATLTQQMEERASALTERIEQLLQRQQQLTERVEQTTAALTGQVNQATTLMTQQLKESAAVLIQQSEQSTAALTGLVDNSTASLTRQMEERIEQLLRQQKQTRIELVMQERRLALLLEDAQASSQGTFNQPLVQRMMNEETHLLDALYASFEDQFRGEREEVRERLRVYLPILKDAGVVEDVLDIGCGRGEWLELLSSEGVRARGVDRNRVFVEQCRQSGLDVLEADALRYLRDLPGESLNAVTSFHLVEHLPFETLIKLLDEIVRTLKPGGLVILETPNPENFIVGSCNFYTDPTHRNPIPSPTLQFLMEARGLYRIEVMKLRPWDAAKIKGESEIIARFNEYFYAAPDYGIIGWKA
jgi:SAM-dependent methyltransferase